MPHGVPFVRGATGKRIDGRRAVGVEGDGQMHGLAQPRDAGHVLRRVQKARVRRDRRERQAVLAQQDGDPLAGGVVQQLQRRGISGQHGELEAGIAHARKAGHCDLDGDILHAPGAVSELDDAAYSGAGPLDSSAADAAPAPASTHSRPVKARGIDGHERIEGCADRKREGQGGWGAIPVQHRNLRWGHERPRGQARR